MAKATGGTTAVGARSPRTPRVKPTNTEAAPPAHDLHATVDDVDPDETTQDFSAGYHSIHGDGHHQVHATLEAAEFAHDDGLHIEKFEGHEDPKNLTAPPARAGYRQCWVNKTAKDYRIMSKRGYTARDPASVPASFHAFQDDRSDSGSQFIEAGEMILMEIPARLQDRNTAAEEDRAKRLQAASTEMLRDANRDGAKVGAAPITGSMTRD